MCGIFCTVMYNQNTFLNEISKKGSLRKTNIQFQECYEAFKNRGPDCYQELNEDISPYTILQFAGSVLWTQGPSPVPQPVVDEDGNILLWNGDIFAGPLASEENDTKVLSIKLLEACRSDSNILEIFALIRGPYSFIYYRKDCKKLYFGRDVIGRHSLVVGFSQRNITISSVAHKKLEGFIEVPAVGIFEFDLEKDGEMPLTLHPWSHISEDLIESKLLPYEAIEKFQVAEPVQTYMIIPKRREKYPKQDDLELWTICTHDPSVSQLMDKLSASDSKTRIKRAMTSLISKPDIQDMLADLLKILKESVRVRLEKQPKYCKNCMNVLHSNNNIEPNNKRRIKVEKPPPVVCNHSKVAILFSGGLDSSVLTAIAHNYVPPNEPIDLLNVAFEKPKNPEMKLLKRSSNSSNNLHAEHSFTVPDRLTGRETLAELKELFPTRKWNFVEISVPLDELKKEREETIASLIYPLNTVLDDSLGCALWFASRGQGSLLGTGESYTSPARIVISGIGADEQLGGYMRHRTTLKHKGGWEALERELQHELWRIPQRNLGRDDRVISSHGKQCRMPYLDEDVINYLNFLAPWQRCYPVESMPPGLGDKLLLRLLAWQIGFRQAANLPKRALQFGSRIANSREKGDEISERL